VERPLISLAGVPKVEKLDFLGVSLAFACRIENPNPFPLSVAGVSYRLELEGRKAAQGSMAAPLAVAPADAGGYGAGTVAVPVGVRFTDVPGFAQVLALDREAAYRLTGEVTFNTPGGLVSVPIAQAGTLVVPRAPRVAVGNVMLRKASPREVALEMSMDVRNPNGFPIPAGRIQYGLFISGNEVVRTEVLIPEPIAAGGSTVLAVPVSVSPFKAGKAAAKLLIPFASMDVGIRGEAVFGGVPVPLDLATSILPAR
jgi:LEA14-like dessication related protein